MLDNNFESVFSFKNYFPHNNVEYVIIIFNMPIKNQKKYYNSFILTDKIHNNYQK